MGRQDENEPQIRGYLQRVRVVVLVRPRTGKSLHQILVSLRVAGEVEDLIETEAVGPLILKGFQKPLPAFSVLGMKSNARTPV